MPDPTSAGAEQRAVQVAGFDHIGDRYDEAFPHKDGQLACGEWLLGRLPSGARVLEQIGRASCRERVSYHV